VEADFILQMNTHLTFSSFAPALVVCFATGVHSRQTVLFSRFSDADTHHNTTNPHKQLYNEDLVHFLSPRSPAPLVHYGRLRTVVPLYSAKKSPASALSCPQQHSAVSMKPWKHITEYLGECNPCDEKIEGRISRDNVPLNLHCI
jgi:hypothetical protein